MARSDGPGHQSFSGQNRPRFADVKSLLRRPVVHQAVDYAVGFALASAAVRSGDQAVMAIAAIAVMRGDADAMITGLEGRFNSKLRNIRDIIGLQDGVRDLSAMSLMITSKGHYFIADTHVKYDPNAEDIADIAELCADHVSRFGITPTSPIRSGPANTKPRPSSAPMCSIATRTTARPPRADRSSIA